MPPGLGQLAAPSAKRIGAQLGLLRHLASLTYAASRVVWRRNGTDPSGQGVVARQLLTKRGNDGFSYLRLIPSDGSGGRVMVGPAVLSGATGPRLMFARAGG